MAIIFQNKISSFSSRKKMTNVYGETGYITLKLITQIPCSEQKCINYQSHKMINL